MSDKTFSGSMVIHYENCSISAGGIKYVDAATTIADKIKINMPHIQNLTTLTSNKELSLQDLHLNDLENSLEVIRLRDQATAHLTAVYVLIGILLIATTLVWIFKRRTITFTPASLDSVVTPATASLAIPSLWPSFHRSA
ncbi:GL14073 [Drosophila persimilis]|uniref:GL14073 n=1 Tax=Drosophila persimilis TaxID=7234 RepID=B4IS28_DROPE|nr:GL14073 [Drosophila persimilis]